MDSIEKLRQRMRSEEQLPQDMQWDAMKEGIMAGLEPKGKSRRKILWWLWGAGTLVALIAVLLMANGEVDNQTPAPSQVATGAPLVKERGKASGEEILPSAENASKEYSDQLMAEQAKAAISKFPVDSKQNIHSTAQEGDKTKTLARTRDERPTQKTDQDDQPPMAQVAAPSDAVRSIPTNSKNQGADSSQIVSSNISAAGTNHPSQDDGPDHLKVLRQGQSSTAGLYQSKRSVEQKDDILPLLPLTAPVAESLLARGVEARLAKQAAQLKIQPLIQPQPNYQATVVEAALGSNLWHLDRAHTPEPSEQTLVGLTADLMVKRRLTQHWTAGVGLRYRHLRSQLESYQRQDTLLTVYQVQQNSLTGVRDTVSLRAAGYNYRSVRHNNTTELVTIPVIVQYSSPVARPIHWSVSGGVEYAFFAQQLGRYVSDQYGDDGLLAIEDLSEGPYNQLTGRLSAQLGLGIEYQMTDALGVAARCRAVRALSSWASAFGSTPTILDLTLGVTYRW